MVFLMFDLILDPRLDKCGLDPIKPSRAATGGSRRGNVSSNSAALEAVTTRVQSMITKRGSSSIRKQYI